MSTESDEALRREMSKPQSVAVPGLTVTRHSLRDQIEMDRYLAKKQVGGRSILPGIKRVNTCPPPMG